MLYIISLFHRPNSAGRSRTCERAVAHNRLWLFL